MSKDVYRAIYRKILYISQNGCKGIKCKKCILNKTCDRYPSHSSYIATLALQTIKQGGK